MGGKPSLDPNQAAIVTAVKLVEGMRTDIDRLAAALGTTRSAVIREALANHLDEHQEVLAS